MTLFTKTVPTAHSHQSQGGAGRLMSRASGRSRRAFTLIEILASVFRFGLVIGVLMPIVHEARVSATRTECQDNPSHIGLNHQGQNAASESSTRASE